MKIQVLVSTMDNKKNDFSIFNKMNIKGSAIACNQSNFLGYHESTDNSDQKILSNQLRGVGRSRNNLLLNSDADICLLADDDMVFFEGYEDKTAEAFNNYPSADIIIFNIDGGQRVRTTHSKKINKITYTKYGAARIAFRRKSILNNEIFFSMLFGGGTTFGSGEDTLFLKRSLDKGLKIIAVDETLAELQDSRESTWFTGFNEKFFIDKGALYYALSKRTFIINALQFSLRKNSLSEGKIGFIRAFRLMQEGKSKYKNILSTMEE